MEEGEEKECPLCLEDLDVTERTFKPCNCGYQVSLLLCLHSSFLLSTQTIKRFAGFVGTTLCKI